MYKYTFFFFFFQFNLHDINHNKYAPKVTSECLLNTDLEIGIFFENNFVINIKVFVVILVPPGT